MVNIKIYDLYLVIKNIRQSAKKKIINIEDLESTRNKDKKIIASNKTIKRVFQILYFRLLILLTKYAVP